jgi:hypothetical protein
LQGAVVLFGRVSAFAQDTLQEGPPPSWTFIHPQRLSLNCSSSLCRFKQETWHFRDLVPTKVKRRNRLHLSLVWPGAPGALFRLQVLHGLCF